MQIFEPTQRRKANNSSLSPNQTNQPVGSSVPIPVAATVHASYNNAYSGKATAGSNSSSMTEDTCASLVGERHWWRIWVGGWSMVTNYDRHMLEQLKIQHQTNWNQHEDALTRDFQSKLVAIQNEKVASVNDLETATRNAAD
jgi:hypothetical protein